MKTDHFWRFPPDTSIREHRERWRCPFPVFPGDAKNWERGNTSNITAVPGVPNVPAARRGPAAVAAGKVDCGSRLNLEEGPHTTREQTVLAREISADDGAAP